MARVKISLPKTIGLAHQLAGRHQKRTTDRILQGAKQLVPRGDHTSGSGERRPGATLAQSLKVKSAASVYVLSDLIGSEKVYAASEHQGSSPHYIHAKNKLLKFEWQRGTLLLAARSRGRGRGRRRLKPRGNYFFFKMVYHPGNKRPVRYLTTPMHLYARLAGFVTSSARVNRARLP